MQYYYVYILTNKTNTVLYTGITNDLHKRVMQHKEKWDEDSFTAKYNVNKLVYYEKAADSEVAAFREKQIKAGSRAKKVQLINQMNPEWNDLFDCIE